jgi:hypothetical protein
MSHSSWLIVLYPFGTLAKAIILCKWAQVPVWLDANLEITPKKALSSTVEAIHASIEIPGFIE